MGKLVVLLVLCRTFRDNIVENGDICHIPHCWVNWPPCMIARHKHQLSLNTLNSLHDKSKTTDPNLDPMLGSTAIPAGRQ